jgi:hypothetical protein
MGRKSSSYGIKSKIKLFTSRFFLRKLYYTHQYSFFFLVEGEWMLNFPRGLGKYDPGKSEATKQHYELYATRYKELALLNQIVHPNQIEKKRKANLEYLLEKSGESIEFDQDLLKQHKAAADESLARFASVKVV